MAKTDDYPLGKISPDLENFKEDVQKILNYGKYSAQVVSTPPVWTANNGEFVFFNSSSTIRRIYLRLNTAWIALDFSGVANGWVNFSGDGAPPVIRNSYNVTSITDNGVGDYTITWDTDFSAGDYSIGGATQYDPGAIVAIHTTSNLLAGSARIAVYVNSGNGLVDAPVVCVHAIGPLG